MRFLSIVLALLYCTTVILYYYTCYYITTYITILLYVHKFGVSEEALGWLGGNTYGNTCLFRGPCCGGNAQSWDQVYSSAESCCGQSALKWNYDGCMDSSLRCASGDSGDEKNLLKSEWEWLDEKELAKSVWEWLRVCARDSLEHDIM